MSEYAGQAEEMLSAGNEDATLRAWIVMAAESRFGIEYDGFFEGLCYTAAEKGLTLQRVIDVHK